LKKKSIEEINQFPKGHRTEKSKQILIQI